MPDKETPWGPEENPDHTHEPNEETERQASVDTLALARIREIDARDAHQRPEQGFSWY